MRPSHVLFTDPPFITGIVLLALRPLFRFDVWPDAHSGAFNDPRWTRFARIHRWMLRRCEQAIIATPSLADAVQEAGARPLILNYPWTEAKLRRETTHPAIVATLGYRFDEPVAELLAAARSIPHVRFVLTGNAPTRLRAEAPPNCRITGWLDRGDYEGLLAEARGVICLTTREDTMQTGAYEAVQYGLPMVLSGTAALRTLFGPGVVFVDDHSPETLAAASTLVWEEYKRLAAEAAGAREHLLQQFRFEVEGLRDALWERDRA